MNFASEVNLVTAHSRLFCRSPVKRFKLILAAASIVVLSACSTASSPGTSTADNVDETQTAGDSFGESESTAAKEYFDAYAASDLEDMRAAGENAAKGSVAQKYMTHQANFIEANDAAGYERYVQDATYEEGKVSICYEGEDCGEFSDLSFEGGRLSSFTVDGKDISDRITIGDGSIVKSKDVAGFEVLSSYQAVEGSLFAVVRFYAYGRPISFSYTPTYRKPSGQQIDSAESDLPSRVAPDSSQDAVVIFPNSENGGDLHLKFATDDDEDEVAGDLIVETVQVPLPAS